MNQDEFAFFNQQLATMLREGIPLEGALRELSEGMSHGPLREEIQRLGADLAQGTPLSVALPRRKLPDLYIQMVSLGAKSNDLSGVLTMLADHYQRSNSLWTRLKGLLVYPVIVAVVGFGLTLILSFVFTHFLSNFFEQFGRLPWPMLLSMWIPPLVLGALVVAAAVALTSPALRARLRWRLPGFREASIAQFASAMSLMLRQGVTLDEALAMAGALEKRTPAEAAIASWRSRVQSGSGKSAQWPAVAPFPPLFYWLVRNHDEDLAEGFRGAAELYRTRAAYRIDLVLYGALPVSILFLGMMVLWEAAPLFRTMVVAMNMLGVMGGD
jgi:type II secretory pathway component PulF